MFLHHSYRWVWELLRDLEYRRWYNSLDLWLHMQLRKPRVPTSYSKQALPLACLPTLHELWVFVSSVGCGPSPKPSTLFY